MHVHRRVDPNRRALILGASTLFGAVALGLPRLVPAAAEPKKKQETEEEVSPAEDLMREHGALNRILLLYDEAATRIEHRKEFPPEVLASAAGIVRRFIEEYHEKLEEEHLFPRFEKAGRLVDLVRTLKAQHEAGRTLTRQIEQGATLAGLRDAAVREKTLRSLRLFIRMYRPHEAREDTVLFPALHEIVSLNEYDALGEQFEDQEHKLFGEDGFEKVVAQIADLEKKVGVYDLTKFTPAAPI
jgi:hemerythrin-like domain-containing protein